MGNDGRRVKLTPDAFIRQRVPHVEEYYDQLRYIPDTLGRYRIKPDQRLAHITINADGYRGEAFTGEETLLLLGDSVTFGVGASGDNARFSRYLEPVLHTGVADASVRAYRVHQHYAQLPMLLKRLPRLNRVMLWCGYADLLYWVTSGGAVEGAFSFEKKYGLQRAAGRFTRMIEKWTSSKESAGPSPKRLLSDLAEHMTVYIASMRDLCRARHLELDVLLQPFLRQRPQNPLMGELFDFYDQKTEAKTGMTWSAACQQFIQTLTKKGADTGVTWIDCQDWVSEEDFLDQVHLRETAHARLAKQFALDYQTAKV
jgi:lysophospholipase L1-like esterase